MISAAAVLLMSLSNHRCVTVSRGAAKISGMDEMEAIRKALRGMAQKICDEWGGEADSVLVEGDAWDIAGRTTHKWSLPPSVVAWVMED